MRHAHKCLGIPVWAFLVSLLLVQAVTGSGSELLAGEFPAQASRVEAPGRCASKIGQGGNLLTDGVALAGKCEGAGQAVRLETGAGGRKQLRFSVGSGPSSDKDRAELAFTQTPLAFGKSHFIGFDVQVPDGTSATKTWFYLAQFWQGPETPPIAGLRMNRGHSHRASFMVRGEGNPNGTIVSRIDLGSGRWVRLAIKIAVLPKGKSCVTVWQRRSRSDRWCGQMGFYGSPNLKPWYRFKFGIYKGAERDATFTTMFRDVRFGSSLVDVW